MAKRKLYTYQATVVKVYDGDTCTVVIDLGFKLTYKTSVRLRWLDAPEVRGEEREKGLIVRDWLRDLLPIGTKVVIESEKLGKYGRPIVVLYSEEGNNINKMMLNHELVGKLDYD